VKFAEFAIGMILIFVFLPTLFSFRHPCFYVPGHYRESTVHHTSANNQLAGVGGLVLPSALPLWLYLSG
jgi:hypothetical protein